MPRDIGKHWSHKPLVAHIVASLSGGSVLCSEAVGFRGWMGALGVFALLSTIFYRLHLCIVAMMVILFVDYIVDQIAP